VSLLNDAGTAYSTAAVGASVTLQNSQCAINLGSSTAIPSGNAVTLNLATTFAPVFAGGKTLYMFAASATGTNSGWQSRGTWTVP
jgi:large repetitive protein